MSERKGTKALELWCKRLVKDCPNPNVQIENMTTSWRNGLAFCAMIHHFRPDLIDISALDPENIYENNKLAFNLAEKHLGIPALLDPEDMVENEVPDRLSILTYLSQFYQRLGHSVNKVSDTESKPSSPSTAKPAAPIKFGKTNLDKCAACNLPVYLAQRLIVAQKLYHRRCFRCSECSAQLNPKVVEFCDFLCDSCKNEKTLLKILKNDDQMGMLAYDDISDSKTDRKAGDINESKRNSVMEKINMFENKTDSCIEKSKNLTVNENLITENQELRTSIDTKYNETDNQTNSNENKECLIHDNDKINMDNESSLVKEVPDNIYKSNINKLNFLKTQLSEDLIDTESTLDKNNELVSNIENTHSIKKVEKESDDKDSCNTDTLDKNESNVTDDLRLSKSIDSSPASCEITNKQEINISVPPRRKKNIDRSSKVKEEVTKPTKLSSISKPRLEKNYPDHLNPFSEDEDENEAPEVNKEKRRVSTNPFGSSDEDDEPPSQTPEPKAPINHNTTRRLISAYNPFWSDGEEPSSEEDTHDNSSPIYKSSMTTSTPNLPSGTPHRKKGKAPPPPIITVESHLLCPATSMDDVASNSSYSSYNSTIHSDQKSFGRTTPRMKTKRVAPTPPESLSGGTGSIDHGVDTVGQRSNSLDVGIRRMKGPAPGLPLPERREVKLQMSPEELQLQLDLLETQQLGLERQGVLIEQMIRDKCEGDEPTTVSQEEVEDLVIQLCELVNEKNDLFRKQTELMYIRRQQRLEQEQADIEHEIRVIQSQPAVNRIDADKAREEQLVSRLVQIVRLRDELVQQIEAERRRERQEDSAIAASIASKRAQRSSSRNSSLKSTEEVAATPKKSKVKDKVKKQLKKAKHSLISKKKDESKDHKEESTKKDK